MPAERVADLRSRQILSLEESIDLSRRLGSLLSTLSPRPEVVVGLADGGILPAAIAAEVAGLDYRIVRVRRRSSSLKRRLKFLRSFHGFLPLRWAWKLVRIADRGLTRSLHRLEFGALDGDFTRSVNGRNVVLVDDCVDSGLSVAQVRARLIEVGASSVGVAVICWATKFDSEILHGVTPDVYLHRGLHRFPWALNSPEYGRFGNWLAQHGFRSGN